VHMRSVLTATTTMDSAHSAPGIPDNAGSSSKNRSASHQARRRDSDRSEDEVFSGRGNLIDRFVGLWEPVGEQTLVIPHCHRGDGGFQPGVFLGECFQRARLRHR